MRALTTFGALLLLHAVTRTSTKYFADVEDHPCSRPCEENAPPLVCKYGFVVEDYVTMSMPCGNCPFNQSNCMRDECIVADGLGRPVITVNRMIPGPMIWVCEGDILEVEVQNKMESASATSIHWHGIYQNGSQYMDGLSMVTQCPISPFSTFTYRFLADHAGTYFYHGHTGVQRSDGLTGPLIIRQPSSREPHASQYDFDLPEHVIFLSDWLSIPTLTVLLDGLKGNKAPMPMSSILINGRGHSKYLNNSDGASLLPRAKFTVSPGKRYRFRVISAASMDCLMVLSIDNHALLLVASDGSPIKGVPIGALVIAPGERYDFVLHARQKYAHSNYWIRVQGNNDCGMPFVSQTAVLQYEGAGDGLPSQPSEWDWARQEHERNFGHPSHRRVQPTVDFFTNTVESFDDDEDDTVLTDKPDVTHYITLNLKYFKPTTDSFVLRGISVKGTEDTMKTTTINNISFTFPSSPLLTQLEDVDQSKFCNVSHLTQEHCGMGLCMCIHTLDLRLGDLVELVLIGLGTPQYTYHPMHLHGQSFRVVGMETLHGTFTGDDIKAMDARGELKRRKSKAARKDTVIVPDKGYTILRFRADNPGFWFFHCHIEMHAFFGMGLLFRVGSPEDLPTPPARFPRCGDWSPS